MSELHSFMINTKQHPMSPRLRRYLMSDRTRDILRCAIDGLEGFGFKGWKCYTGKTDVSLDLRNNSQSGAAVV